MSASALLRVVAEANPDELLRWAEANAMPAPVLAALNGARTARLPQGSAWSWRAAAEYRAAVIYVQAELVRLALARIGGEP